MNLPNSLTLGRILAAPLVAWLPFVDSWVPRLAGFLLFVVVAVTDYYDGKLARSRNSVTSLGALLDPLADKLLLVATFLPMYVLQAPRGDALHQWFTAGGTGGRFPFVTPFGTVGLPWWVLAIVIGRELFITLFRQAAARRGVVIAAIGPAKWKTGFQWTWVGSAFFWFFAATVAAEQGWRGGAWNVFAAFNGLVGTVTMAVAIGLTLYSMALYLWRYGSVFTGAGAPRSERR